MTFKKTHVIGVLFLCWCLSGCFVKTEKPLFTEGVDIGIDAERYALLNTGKEVSIAGSNNVSNYKMFRFERHGNHHFFKDVLATTLFIDEEPSLRQENSIKNLVTSSEELSKTASFGSLLFQPLQGYPNQFLAQDKYSDDSYYYYLVKKENDHLYVSFMGLDKEGITKAKQSGIRFKTTGTASTFLPEDSDQLIDYAHFWLESHGNAWYRLPQDKNLNPWHGSGVRFETHVRSNKQLSFEIVTNPQSIESLEQQTLDEACLVLAGHPDSPEVQALPAPHNHGKLINAIETKEAITLCNRTDKTDTSMAVQYALARAYNKEKRFLMESGKEGALDIANRLSKQGYGLGHVMLAKAYYDGKGVEKDQQKAARLLEQDAPKNDPSVMHMLGSFYLNGVGFFKDSKRAFQLFQRAAEAGHAGAKASLAWMYLYSSDIKKNPDKGLQLLRAAVSQGDVSAQHLLGHEYSTGNFLQQNDVRAHQNFTKAANAGSTESMYRLALMEINGKGTEKNRAKALKWAAEAAQLDHKKARDLHSKIYFQDPEKASKNSEYLAWLKDGANDGDPELQFLMGWVAEIDKNEERSDITSMLWYEQSANQGYLKGLMAAGRKHLSLKSLPKAIEYYEQALQKGDGRAAWQLGEIFYDGLRGYGDLVTRSAFVIERDIDKAISYYDTATNFGIYDGWHRLGKDYFSGRKVGVGKDREKGLSYLQKAANAGDMNSQRYLGTLYFDGEHVTKDYSKARYWYQQAAKKGDGLAQFGLGYIYQFGQGVNKDYSAAINWYDKATKNGVHKAWHNLGYMVEKGLGYQQDTKRAIEFYEYAISKGVKNSHVGLARIYATEVVHGHPKKALEHAESAIKFKDNVLHRELLAASYAINSRFNEAVAEQATAIAQSARAGKSFSGQDERLQQYRNKERLNCFDGKGVGCNFY